MGLKPGDHLVTLLQNNWQAATLHWACQFAGIIVTPVNWRAKDDEIDFYLDNAEARAVAYQDVSAAAVAAAKGAAKLPRIARRRRRRGRTSTSRSSSRPKATDAPPRVDADAWSLMLYTSGTTSRPKGVPRRHRAERAAAVAHVAQNLYAHGERTLGVMPLYHTMGVRSLLAMSLIGGAFVCLPQFDVGRALPSDRRRAGDQSLSGADALPRSRPSSRLRRRRRNLGAQARLRRRADDRCAAAKSSMTAFRPDLFVNHYGSSEIYTFTIDQNAARKPGSAGRAGINQMIRVVRLGAKSADEIAAARRGRRNRRPDRRR